jgi:hypothetical protein
MMIDGQVVGGGLPQRSSFGDQTADNDSKQQIREI